MSDWRTTHERADPDSGIMLMVTSGEWGLWRWTAYQDAYTGEETIVLAFGVGAGTADQAICAADAWLADYKERAT